MSEEDPIEDSETGYSPGEEIDQSLQAQEAVILLLQHCEDEEISETVMAEVLQSVAGKLYYSPYSQVMDQLAIPPASHIEDDPF